MILWKDFILDDVLGAVLSPEIFAGDVQESRNRVATKSSVMEGAKSALIQETRQDSEPARMVGESILDYSNAATRMDSGDFSAAQLRQRGTG